jgi:hypothetical protein
MLDLSEPSEKIRLALLSDILGAFTPFINQGRTTALTRRSTEGDIAVPVEALGVSPNDIFITLIPVPIENFSFGRGELQLAGGAPRW